MSWKYMKVAKFPGPEGICPRILRRAREEIVGVLTQIFVPFLVTFSEDDRKANTPLFKKT